MKIPVWLVLILLFLGGYAGLRGCMEIQTYERAKYDSLNYAYDSLISEMGQLEFKFDSLLIQANIKDTIVRTIIKRIPYEVNHVVNLNADSSIRLFNEWARFLSDSTNRAGYIRLSTYPIH